ncbi:MAG: F0F1 ATP synthase subunit A [Mycoplasmoidaceae bacterium]|nr:F0F1 ATP synthase subunit A [Mycoplasmoidaceae bacterium]
MVYYVKSRKLKANEAPTGYVLAIEIYVSYFRNMVHEILGPKLDKLTPLFVFIFTYILISNIIGVFGLDNPTGSYTVTLSMALIMYFGVWVVGFKYQKLSYLKNFCFKIKTKKGKQIPVFINPLEVMSNIAPLISMSFRL